MRYVPFLFVCWCGCVWVCGGVCGCGVVGVCGGGGRLVCCLVCRAVAGVVAGEALAVGVAAWCSFRVGGGAGVVFRNVLLRVWVLLLWRFPMLFIPWLGW